MSSTLRTFSFCLAALLLLAFGVAEAPAHDEGHGEHQRRVKIVACDGGETTEISADDLALGETRDIDTSCGKVVSVTRTFDDELRLAIDGREINILGHGIDIEEIDEDGDGAVRRKVLVRTHGGECEEGEECEQHRKVRRIVIGDDSEVDLEVLSLLDGELLEDCEEGEEDCRARILHLLGGSEAETDGEHVVVIKKRVHKQDGEEGDDGDEEE